MFCFFFKVPCIWKILVVVWLSSACELCNSLLLPQEGGIRLWASSMPIHKTTWEVLIFLLLSSSSPMCIISPPLTHTHTPHCDVYRMVGADRPTLPSYASVASCRERERERAVIVLSTVWSRTLESEWSVYGVCMEFAVCQWLLPLWIHLDKQWTHQENDSFSFPFLGLWGWQ